MPELTLAERERCLCCHPPPYRETPVRALRWPGTFTYVREVAKGYIGPSPYSSNEPFSPPHYLNVYWAERCDFTLALNVQPFGGEAYSPLGVHEAKYFWQRNDLQTKWRLWAIWATPCAVPWPCEATCAPEVIEDE